MDWQAFEAAFTGQQITVETVISAVIVIAVGVLLAWFLGRRLRRAVGRPGDTNQQTEKLVGRIVQWGVIGISIAWALSILGLDIGWFAVFLALALVISSFALKPLVQSFATSVLIASRPAFSVGDDICVDDVAGEVIEITERSVVIRQRDGARVHVPNVKVLAKKVTVYSTETDRRSVIELKLAIDTDVEHVEHVARTSLGDLEEVTRFGVGSRRVTRRRCRCVDCVLAPFGPRGAATCRRRCDPSSPTFVRRCRHSSRLGCRCADRGFRAHLAAWRLTSTDHARAAAVVIDGLVRNNSAAFVHHWATLHPTMTRTARKWVWDHAIWGMRPTSPDLMMRVVSATKSNGWNDKKDRRWITTMCFGCWHWVRRASPTRRGRTWSSGSQVSISGSSPLPI
jgi:small-conductance mechanosensitive channel